MLNIDLDTRCPDYNRAQSLTHLLFMNKGKHSIPTPHICIHGMHKSVFSQWDMITYYFTLYSHYINLVAYRIALMIKFRFRYKPERYKFFDICGNEIDEADDNIIKPFCHCHYIQNKSPNNYSMRSCYMS